jgi:AAA domain, putative AbiEii toxin, Type IV TA system
MLKALKLSNVGPVPEVAIKLASRLNLFTGDNGLGKTFLLDICWWALTRRWPNEVNPKLTSGFTARPNDVAQTSSICFTIDGKTTNDIEYSAKYEPREEGWKGSAGRPPNPGLVVYAQADGGFSVWDPARNYWLTKGNLDTQDRIPAYVFSPREIWDGLDSIDERPSRLCNGLISDWSGWIKENGVNAKHMRDLLCSLVPDGDCIEVVGNSRLSVNDARDIPTIRPPYGGNVPIVHASAGIKRALGLAYMLVWSWNEHVQAATLLGEARTNQVVLLFDELESHLHPRWQRTILRSVLDASKTLHETAQVQLLAATHSPFVLASAEPFFDPEFDAWFDLDLVDNEAVLEQRIFTRQGDVSNWLTSDAFDLQEARSLEAETAIVKALGLLRHTNPEKSEVAKVTEDLKASLSEIDRFWMRWSAYVEQHEASTKTNA